MTDEPQAQEPGPETTPPAEPAPETGTPEGGPATAVADDQEKAKRLNQTVELRDVGPCKKHIKVTVDREAIDERFKEKYSELVKNANVAGFRPGKAPLRVIQRRFARDVNDQVKNELLYASLEQLADEQDIAPLAPPDINPANIQLPESGPFVYEFSVEVRPQFDLPNYKGLKLKRPVHTHTADEIADMRRRLLQPHGQIVPKPGGAVESNDVVTADITFKDGDNVLSESKDITFRVEKQLALRDAVAPRFAEQVQGAKAGETRTVDLDLSTQVGNPALRGKPVQMQLTFREVKTIRLPELSEEFLQSNFFVASDDALTELAESLLKRRLEYQQRQSARQQVMQQIAAAAGWDLPQDLLIRQARRSLNRRIMEMRSEGMKDEEIQGRLRLLQQDVLRSTEAALKEHFVLQKIAETEKIEVNDDDIETEIDRIAEQTDDSPRRVRARLEKDDMMEALAAEMIERKALDLILEAAEYEDVPLRGDQATEEVATVEEQAVPGAMRDLEKESAEQAAEQAGEQAGEQAAAEPPAEAQPPAGG